MAIGKYPSLEEARKAKKLDRFAKETPHEGRRTKMSQWYRAIVFIIGIPLFSTFNSASGAEDLLDELERKVNREVEWGAWTDREEKVTYTFLEDHEFRFRWKRGQGQPDVMEEGAWETGTGICWPGAKDEGSKGNVMLYVDTKQCCLTARRLGKNLVLSLIWEKGGANACQNRVLRRSGDEK